MNGIHQVAVEVIYLLRERLRKACLGILAFLMAGVALSAPVGAAAPDDDDMTIAQRLAEMLRDARTVISNQQDLINDPNLGDKHLTGKIVVERAPPRRIAAERTDSARSRRGTPVKASFTACR